MSSEDEQESSRQSQSKAEPNGPDQSMPLRRELLPLPGLAAIGLYMLVLSGVVITGVANGYVRPVYLIFSALFIAASLGLLLLFRWAWTLTLAAVVLLMGLFLWRFTSGHDLPSIAQGLLNLVMFFYLVRPEVRAHLR